MNDDAVSCLFQGRGEKNHNRKIVTTLDPDQDPLLPNVDPRIRIRIHYYGKVDPRIWIPFSQVKILGSGSGSKSK